MHIEKNIALPARTNQLGSVWKEIAKNMEVGDSVLTPNSIAGKNLYQALKALKMNSATRQVRQGGEMRVWRV